MPKQKSENDTRSDIAKVADSLAAQSRKLRQAADAEKAAQRESGLERVRAATAPLLEVARRRLAEAVALQGEHAEFIERMASLPWNDLRKTVRVRITGESSTVTRLGLLQRVVEDTAELLHASDDELQGLVVRVSGLTTLDSRDAQQNVARLSHLLSLYDRPAAIRSKIRTVLKLMADLTEDFASPDAFVQPQVVPVIDEHGRRAGEAMETAAVGPTRWPADGTPIKIREEAE